MMLLAKALYDNVGETPEELSFHRGDILSVLEQDTSGLEGWWLCSLKGRRGIVPGNRLRVLDSITAQKEAALQKMHNRTGSQGETRNLSWHKPDQVVTPQRSGNMFLYNKPGMVDTSLDYDVPRPESVHIPSTQLHVPQPPRLDIDTDYDHPTSNQPVTRKLSPGDSIQLELQMAALDRHDIPNSNRSSTISMLSTGSNVSGLSSISGLHSSVCESERSSLDLSGHETYDVPPTARPLPNISKTRSVDSNSPKSVKKMAASNSPCAVTLGDYDRLKNASSLYDSPKQLLRPEELITYDTPRPLHPVSRNCSGDSGISVTLKNLACDPSQNYDSPVNIMSKVKETAESDYDTPKSSAYLKQVQNVSAASKQHSSEQKLFGGPAVSSGEAVNIYDVPPCVTRDTYMYKKTDADKPPSSEHYLELNSAMESLVTLQHNLNTSCSKLLGFVHPAWRTPDNLEPHAYSIKVAANSVKTAGESFLQFGCDALGNALRTGDTVLVKKLRAAVEMLSGSLEIFSECLQRLNKNMWPLVSLVRNIEVIAKSPDDLDRLISVAQEIPDKVRSISCLIQGNSIHLFKRSSGSGSSSGTQNAETPPASTPKLKSKPPPPVKPKPRLSVDSLGEVTPLPKFSQKNSMDSSPVNAHSSPPTKDINMDNLSETNCDYDVPKPLAKPVAEPPKSTSHVHDVMEYDYVSLTKSPGDTNVLTKPDNSKDVEIRQKPEEPHGRSRAVQSLFPPTDLLTSGLSNKFKDKLEQLQKEAEEPVKVYSDDYDVPQSVKSNRASAPPSTTAPVIPLLEPNDLKLLQFYAVEIVTHETILINAIEVFIKCIDEQHSPKAFIACSKFVILAAHKMVYIGDTLTRHVGNEAVRTSVMNCAYNLCEMLKMTINATKKAALDFPQVKSVQEMVDKVSEVSVNASGLKQTILQYTS